MRESRRIDQRFKPPVKGIDLWQAMNYVPLDEVGRDFIYNGHTSATICYTAGSRPVLERTVGDVCGKTSDPLDRLGLLTSFVAEQVRWAGFHEHEKGVRLPVDRNFTEEQILKSGFGWCNEQSRLLCALAQIADIPARIVFASNREGTFGHVVIEVLTPRGWMMIDQSLDCLFLHDGRPLSAWEVWHDPSQRDYFQPIYRAACQQLRKALGPDLLSRDFKMCMEEEPLSGFGSLGYCNCFV